MATNNRIRKDSAMLIDIQYVRANKAEGLPDYLYIIWKDLDSGKKYLEKINNPPVNIFFMKPEYRNYNYHKTEAPFDQLYKVQVPYSDIISVIAKEEGPDAQQFLSDCYKRNDYKNAEQLKTSRWAFGHDYDIRTLYRNMWMKEYNNDRPKVVTKAFADIEVDSLEYVGVPQGGTCPIDLITIIDDETLHVYTFCLMGVTCKEKNFDGLPTKEAVNAEIKRRELYEHRLKEQDYWIHHKEELIQSAHDMFDENYPGFTYDALFYTDEKEMLTEVFKVIHLIKADFLMFWNISFDIPYILDRMKVLGMNPYDIIPHPDFPNKQCYFKKDNLHFAVKNKTDFFNVSDYTIYIDQMVTYAAMRKGGAELRRYQLTYIAEKEIGDAKLDYSDNGNIKTLSYNNWQMYYLYNIKDVLLQKGIEDRTSDIDTLYIYSYENLTQYENVFKQTVKLRNLQYSSWEEQGLVPGANINAFNYDERDDDGDYDSEDDDSDSGGSSSDVGYEGALVGNPLLNGYFGAKLYGKRANNIFLFSIDMDMSAFYPNTVSAMNIYPACLIFKMIVDPRQFKPRGGVIPFHGITDVQVVKENRDSFRDDVGKEVMDNFITRHYISFAHKWMNFPSVKKVYNRLKKVV